MTAWTTAQIGEIDEISDGRVPWRPVRHHFGIRSFGLNVFSGKDAGDRLINEHDETDDGNEEIYFAHSGRARFELDGETLEASPGTFVYAKPEVKAHGVRGGAEHDARRHRRHTGKGLRG